MTYLVVEGLIPTELDDTNIRDDVWSLALDQRCFGRRKIFVVFGDRDGTFRGLAYTDRLDNPEDALGPCIDHLGMSGVAAIVLCDEEVAEGPMPIAHAERFERAYEIAARLRVHLVDWIACDDDKFRSTRMAIDEPGEPWWDL